MCPGYLFFFMLQSILLGVNANMNWICPVQVTAMIIYGAVHFRITNEQSGQSSLRFDHAATLLQFPLQIHFAICVASISVSLMVVGTNIEQKFFPADTFTAGFEI